MATIHKKVLREYFEKIISGKKKLELRLADFEINEGDTLVLEEWDKDKKEYTGRNVEVIATYILKTKGQTFWPPEEVEKYGFQIIQFKPKKNNMIKRAFIIHGWNGYPDEGWFPWLKAELEKNGFQVHVPAMPESAEPKIEAWVSHLSKIVGDIDENSFFVGHSIGCQTILRYLESLPANKKVGGAVFVAGWFSLMNLKTDEEKEIAKPWLETPIDFKKVKQHTKKFFAVFSDDDEVVPQENKKLFSERLGAKTAIEHAKGHFSGSDGVKELSVILDAILAQ